MSYARSENEDKERLLKHAQPDMQKPQHYSINVAVPNKTSIHTRMRNGIDLLIEIAHGIIKTAMPMRG